VKFWKNFQLVVDFFAISMGIPGGNVVLGEKLFGLP